MKPINKLLFRVKIQQVIIITIAWTIVGLLISMGETYVFDYRADALIINKPMHQTLTEHFFYNLLSSLFGSFIGATMLVFWLEKRFTRSSYGRMIFLNSLFYTLIILLISTIVGFVYSSIYYQTSIFDKVVLESVVNFFTSFMVIKVFIIWYGLTAFTVFLLEVNKKYGPWVLYRLVIGKYHRPRTEQRIFMFLDLKSSTTIAEKIGHNSYFKFLKQLYQVITYPILSYGGEIYQYVGDEVVITWTEKSGAHHAQCVTCFYGIMKIIQQHQEDFKSRFNFAPTFRAGIHTGQVTAGEIGIIKKDIVYTGDVLNTTARIVEHCRKENVDLIVSEQLLEKMPRDIPYSFKSLGMVQLKGKIQFQKLFKVAEEAKHSIKVEEKIKV